MRMFFANYMHKVSSVQQALHQAEKDEPAQTDWCQTDGKESMHEVWVRLKDLSLKAE